jgi:hypothetical protein
LKFKASFSRDPISKKPTTKKKKKKGCRVAQGIGSEFKSSKPPPTHSQKEKTESKKEKKNEY